MFKKCVIVLLSPLQAEPWRCCPVCLFYLRQLHAMNLNLNKKYATTCEMQPPLWLFCTTPVRDSPLLLNTPLPEKQRKVLPQAHI